MWSCHELSESKTLLLAHALPTSHPVHKAMADFQQFVEVKSGGKLKVKMIPDGQLGSEREVLELLQIGSVAITKVSAAALANFAPEYEVLGVPYLFRDKEHLFKVLEGKIGKELLNSSRNYWLQGLCFYDAGSRSFYTKDRPIRTPEDLKGLKIRVMNHQMSIEMVNSMGGSATPMAFGEIYTALQQGVVDGAENNPPSLVSTNHYEVCDYYSLDEHSVVPDVMVIGTKFWDKLNEQEKEWVQASADESVVTQKRYWAESVEECMQILRDAGVEIVHPDKAAFVEKTQSVIANFTKDQTRKRLVEAIRNE